MKVLPVVLGMVGLSSAWILKRPLARLTPEALMVMNFRGRRIPAVGGMVLMLSLLGCAGGLGLVAAGAPAFPQGPVPDPASPAVRNSLGHFGIMMLAAGFFALGSIDDMAQGGHSKGIRGHLSALRKGQVTGGLIKAGGGLTLSFFVSSLWGLGLANATLGALVIASSANLLNLLDLRPGRACKFFFVAWAPLALIASSRAPHYLPLSSGLAGAAVGWMPDDLRERGTLGDSGSNMLGAVAGAGIVLVARPVFELLALAVLAALTLASERFSFTNAIAAFGPLRWIDSLGRAPE